MPNDASDNLLQPACPQCGCVDLRAYRTSKSGNRIVRYRYCRHCGHRVITTQPLERICRAVGDNLGANSNIGKE